MAPATMPSPPMSATDDISPNSGNESVRAADRIHQVPRWDRQVEQASRDHHPALGVTSYSESEVNSHEMLFDAQSCLNRTGFFGDSIPWKRMEHGREQRNPEEVPA